MSSLFHFEQPPQVAGDFVELSSMSGHNAALQVCFCARMTWLWRCRRSAGNFWARILAFVGKHPPRNKERKNILCHQADFCMWLITATIWSMCCLAVTKALLWFYQPRSRQKEKPCFVNKRAVQMIKLMLSRQYNENQDRTSFYNLPDRLIQAEVTVVCWKSA